MNRLWQPIVLWIALMVPAFALLMADRWLPMAWRKPGQFWWLALLPVLGLFYVWALRRRERVMALFVEARLLPGALMRNASQHFICRTVSLKVENSQSLFTQGYEAGQEIRIPVAHHDGNYFADDATLDELESEGRVAFRYVENCNGSQRDIAGVLNKAGNVLGMMPHPERAVDAAHGGTDGAALFEGAMNALASA